MLYAWLSPPRPAAPNPTRDGLAGPLTRYSVGRALKPGTYDFTQGIFSLRSNAGDIGGMADNCDFFAQDFHGNGEIVARILDVGKNTPNGKAGLMIRAGDEPNARYAMVFVTGGGELGFRYRIRDGALSMMQYAGAVKRPIWLKLMRQDQQFRAFKLTDGRGWQFIGQTLPETGRVARERGAAGTFWKPTALAGLALAPGMEGLAATATVDQFTVREFTRAAPADDAPVEPKAPEMEAVPLELSGRGVLTRNGTFLANATIASADKTTVRFTRPSGGPLATEYSQLARINLQPLTAGMLARIPRGLSGVLLSNGDFMEGEIGGLTGDRVTVSSVVFGLSTYRLADEIRAIIFRPPGTMDSAYRVQLVDGSVLAARSIKASPKAELVVDDQATGIVTLPVQDICVLRAGSLRCAQLTDLKPDKIEAPAGLDPASSSVFDALHASWMNVAGVISERGIVAPGGSTLTYSLDSGYRMFMCRAGVPDRVAMKVAVRFVVTADGKEIFRSPIRTSAEAPIAISVDVAGVKELELAVETAGDTDVPSFGLWGDPLLTK